MQSSGLTQRLQGMGAAGERTGGGEFLVRVANDLESRRRAYQLVYQLYLDKEYAEPHPAKMWLSLFDALPETTTLLVERPDGQAVGALTVVFDSSMGLPADGLYGPEIDALRSSGRRLAEVVSLGVAEKAQAGTEVLVRLFNSAYFVARGIRGATDFVITVNPRHVRFYERLMLFSAAGPEREYERVGGAPAVLLRLDFALAERARPEALAGSWAGRQQPIYGRFLTVSEAGETVSALRGQLRPMSTQECRHFLVETSLLARATEEQRVRLRERCPACALLA